MAGDEVVFYYKPNQHVWEFIFKKQLTWNEDESNYSFDDPPTEDDADTDEYRNLDTPYHYQNTGSSVPAPFLLACVLFFGHAKLSFIETKGLRSSR
ncbi:hypothetical protein JHK85_055938 [Glycine max]|nr:hypothetical protein JHK85_055938 [Glycine max]